MNDRASTTGSISTESRPIFRGFLLLLLAFASLKLIIHLAVGEGYGYFRDEFYYLACARHLDWGYVDHPPLSILILWSIRALIGESAVAIRLPAALAGAATVFMGGWMARDLGGGRFAQALTMVSVIAAPLYLAMNGFYSMNSFDILLWAVAASLLIRILKCRRRKLWLLLGGVLGLALMNKLSVLWLGAGILVGLLLSAAGRRSLRTPWPYAGGAIATLIFTPHLLWQVANDWPTLEFIHNATTEKMLATDPTGFLLDQLLFMNPLAAPVWIAGLLFYLVARDGRECRALGIAYLTVLAILITSSASRSDYLGPAYPMLFAAGGVILERALRRTGRVWPQTVALVLLGSSGAALSPLTLPVLPVEKYISYSRFLGVAPSTGERKELAELPQFYADMFGWEEIVTEVARVWASLSPEEQRVAGIFTGNYGEAGAIDLLGRRHGLPPAISGHNNYWLWGPRGHTGEVLIILGGSEKRYRSSFATVELAGSTDCGYCMPYENRMPIFVARGHSAGLSAVWPRVKHFQ